MKPWVTYHLYQTEKKLEKSLLDFTILGIWRGYRRIKKGVAGSDNLVVSKLYLKYQNLESELLGRKYYFVNLDTLIKWVDEWVKDIPSDIDIFIGIPRSGLLVANLLALKRGKPLSTPELFTANQYWQSKHISRDSVKKVLLVDDSASTGETMEDYYNKLKKACSSLIILKAAPIVSRKAKSKIDYYYKIIPQPRFFEWNMVHWKRCKIAVDLDGVLCEDCPPGVDQNERLYDNWLKNARPLIIPEFEIDAIVSNRLEKYRGETEKWLKKNGIRYRTLEMWKLNSKKERRGNYSKNKIDKLLVIKPDIFWESSLKQAEDIFKATGVPTLSVDQKVLFS